MVSLGIVNVLVGCTLLHSNYMQSVPSPIALMCIAAWLASFRWCLRLRTARYATGTAAEILPQAGFKPSPNNTYQQVVGMRFTNS